MSEDSLEILPLKETSQVNDGFAKINNVNYFVPKLKGNEYEEHLKSADEEVKKVIHGE